MAFINKIGNILKQTTHKLPSFGSSTDSASIYQAIRCFSSKLFIGGLSYATDDNSLREAFSPYGDVVEARIIIDRETGRSRGFGFISYPSAEEASAAIQALDGRELHGRFIRVAYAADRTGTSHGPRVSSGGYDGSLGGTGGYGVSGSYSAGNYSSQGSSNYGASGSYDNSSSTGGGGGRPGGYGGSNYGSTDIGRSQDMSNRASGNYGYTAGDNFGGHASNGYGYENAGKADDLNYENSVGQEYGNLDKDANNSSHDPKGNINENGIWKDDAPGYANSRMG